MALKIIETGTVSELEFVLNGGLRGGTALALSGGRVLGLHGLTLIIGAETVTFSDASGGGLTVAALLTAIEAGTTGVTATVSGDGRLSLANAAGVTVDKDGTANKVLGFNTAADSVGVAYNGPGGDVPKVHSVSGGVRDDSYFAFVEVS